MYKICVFPSLFANSLCSMCPFFPSFPPCAPRFGFVGLLFGLRPAVDPCLPLPKLNWPSMPAVSTYCGPNLFVVCPIHCLNLILYLWCSELQHWKACALAQQYVNSYLREGCLWAGLWCTGVWHYIDVAHAAFCPNQSNNGCSNSRQKPVWLLNQHRSPISLRAGDCM